MQRSLASSSLSGLVRSRSLFTNPQIISRPQRLFPLYNLAVPSGRQAFSNSPPLCKKKDKSKKSTPAAGSEVTKSSNDAEASDDPLALSQLQDDIAAAVFRLKDDLSKLRAGGRLNTEAIESLRVQLSKGSKDTVKLGELAQVVPKGGRMVTILAAEEDVSRGSLLPIFFPLKYNICRVQNSLLVFFPLTLTCVNSISNLSVRQLSRPIFP